MSRIVGLVGGLGPESTIDYYRRIITRWQKYEPDSSPRLVIDSPRLPARHPPRGGRSTRADRVPHGLHPTARPGAGVDLVAMTANTPHIVFDELAAHSPVPMLSIVETCADEARSRGLRRLALLGTRFTMEASFYPAAFARRGIAIVPPDDQDRSWVHERYLGELVPGVFKDETRERFVALIERLKAETGIDGVILGGTELPILLQAPVVAGLPMLDTTELHVQAIVSEARRRT
jgi:aspartate racemase